MKFRITNKILIPVLALIILLFLVCLFLFKPSNGGYADSVVHIKRGNKTVEKRYYISSLLLNIELFSRAIRSHWSIENKLHWQMDFTFKCDNNMTVDKKAAFNLQIMKKNALSILNMVKEEYKLSMKKIRFKACLNPEVEVPKMFFIAKKKGWNFDKIMV